MSATKRRVATAGLLGLAIAAGGAAVIRWREAEALRREIGLLKEQSDAVVRLREENARLKAAQAPAAEVERLRADRAAVLRLRGEIEAMKGRAEKRAQSEADATLVRAPVAMQFSLGKGGLLTEAGGQVDYGALGERFRALAVNGRPVELRLGWAESAGPFVFEQAKESMKRIAEMARDAGVRFELIFDPPRAREGTR